MLKNNESAKEIIFENSVVQPVKQIPLNDIVEVPSEENDIGNTLFIELDEQEDI